MAIAERLITMLSQWAKGAQTNIPTPPVPGIAYRNASLTAVDIENGQAYDKVYDSARYNQVDYMTTGLVQGLEQYGILPWSSLTNYPESGICMGLDGVLYQALQASGPANGGPQPTSNEEYWNSYGPKNVLTLDYFLCIKVFKFIHPTPKSGMVPVNGTLLSDAVTRYPQAFAYLQTQEGQALCTSEVDWQAAHNAFWHTLADGTQIGWDGIGGICKYVIDTNAGTIRVPDLRGMYEEMAGFDSLDVGGTHLDVSRRLEGYMIYIHSYADVYPATYSGGALSVTRYGGASTNIVGGSTDSVLNVELDNARVMPVGNKVAPRAWGALPCVYLGAPR